MPVQCHCGGARGPLGGWRAWPALSGCLLLALSLTGFAADDDYLKQITSEATKVGASKAAGPAPAAAAADVKAFEEELKTRYRGSFLFFEKLPPASREEIVLEYQKGASIEDIRNKIMSRFLHEK